MNPDDPLQALHPLREPPAIGWWPPAIGWWLLGALLLALLVLLVTALWRRQRRNRYRRLADAELQELRSAQLTDTDAVQQVSAILKRAALAAYPDTPVAALGGDDWMHFLDQSLPPSHRVFTGIGGDLLYAPHPDHASVIAFTDAAAAWIRHHRRVIDDA